MFKDNNMDTRATSFMVSIVHGHSLFLINLEPIQQIGIACLLSPLALTL